MSDKTGFIRCWECVDRLLLFLVIVLIAVCWRDMKHADERWGQGYAVPLGRVKGEAVSRVSVPTASRVNAGLQVTAGRSRVSSIARTMADSEWEDLPSSPTADMREQDGFYDILFSLPNDMDVGSVKVSTSGNVLTLFVNAAGLPAATFVKQFYIPCGAERAGAVETSVSNDIVRVRIRQPVR